MTLQSGEWIDQYTIVQKLGHGGMSAVYLANDTTQRREVVLKFPHEDMAGDPTTYERFRREIQIGELLIHPNIQKPYDRAGDHRDPYMALEYVAGARWVTRGQLAAQVGTPDYMVPEQIKGQRGDQRTDIYVLGMILYECLAGCLPYEGDNALVVMNQHVTVSPPLLNRFVRDVPVALEETVMKAIRRSAGARWPSMELFTATLQHPEQVDIDALHAEREQQETSAGDCRVSAQFGVPTWQVALIVLAVIVGLVTFGALIRILHGS